MNEGIIEKMEGVGYSMNYKEGGIIYNTFDNKLIISFFDELSNNLCLECSCSVVDAFAKGKRIMDFVLNEM